MHHLRWLLACGVAASAANAAEVADYRFEDTLQSSIAGAPALEEIAPGGGLFVDTVVDGKAVRGWSFPADAGFSLPIAGLVGDQQFSIALLLRVADTGGYSKLVDVSSRTSDAGLYFSTGSLVYYPDAIQAPQAVQANTYHQVVLTRSAAGEMVGYVDGAEQFRYIDLEANGVVLDGTLAFLRDDTVTDGEDPSGVIVRLRLFDHVLSSDEVRALRAVTRVFRDGFEPLP